MSDQLFVVGLGIGEDAAHALLLSGLAGDEPDVLAYGVVATTGYVTSSTSVASGSPLVTVTSQVTATTSTDSPQ